ncbi:MAG: hypothetical protein WAM95_19095 [Bacillus sp. (in: firmicutes)]
MLGNWHVRCGAGEKLEIISKVYLLQTLTEVAKGEREINLETTNSTFNFGDILFTLFSLGFTILIIALIVSLIRTNNKRKQQLDRIEKKIEDLDQQSRNE